MSVLSGIFFGILIGLGIGPYLHLAFEWWMSRPRRVDPFNVHDHCRDCGVSPVEEAGSRIAVTHVYGADIAARVARVRAMFESYGIEEVSDVQIIRKTREH